MDDLIARARKLDTTATSGPWARECTGQGNAVFCLDKNITPPGLRLEDANFIAQSRTLLPALADALETVRKALAGFESQAQGLHDRVVQLERELAKRRPVASAASAVPGDHGHVDCHRPLAGHPDRAAGPAAGA